MGLQRKNENRNPAVKHPGAAKKSQSLTEQDGIIEFFRSLVSRGWAWKISAARKRSGRMERPGYRPGPSSQMDRDVLAGLLARNADWTLRQLQTAMEKQTGVRFGEPYLWRVLKRLNFRLKKSHFMPPSATAKPTKSGASSSLRKSARPRRNA